METTAIEHNIKEIFLSDYKKQEYIKALAEKMKKNYESQTGIQVSDYFAIALAERYVKGFEKGYVEGLELAKGEKKRSAEIAKTMLSMNIPLETISKATGLNKDELLNI